MLGFNEASLELSDMYSASSERRQYKVHKVIIFRKEIKAEVAVVVFPMEHIAQLGSDVHQQIQLIQGWKGHLKSCRPSCCRHSRRSQELLGAE